MRHILLTLLLGFFLSIESRADWPIDRMNEQIEKTNVIVGSGCSGTFIEPLKDRLVLTAHHCINRQLVEETVETIDPKTGEISTKRIQKRLPLTIAVSKIVDYEYVSRTEHLVKIVADDPQNDIAILQVVDADFVPGMAAPLAPDTYQYRRGLRVYAVGNPAVEFDNSITEGIISAPMRPVDFGTGYTFKMFQHSAATIGGNSGGAVLNEDGELIGTTTGGIPGAPVGFSIPISFTKELLRRAGFRSDK